MSLRNRYRFNRRKSIKPYFKLIILVVLMTSILPTFLRYTNMGMSEAVIPTAQFSVKVNNSSITSETDTIGEISLLNAENHTPNIDSGDTCYFEIIIDPTATEVSISYLISANLETASNLPEGTVIKKYEKYAYENDIYVLESTHDILTSSVDISENIMLSNTNTALSSTSKVKYKFYCEIPFPIDTIKDTAYTITPNITVEQYISQ